MMIFLIYFSRISLTGNTFYFFIPMRAKQVREVANLTERKNPYTSVYGVKEFVRLSVSVYLLQTLTPIIS